MIELHDVIEAANKHIDKSKGFLVLHKAVKLHPTFKVYKTYCYGLYLVNSVDPQGKCVLRHDVTKNSPSEDMNKDWEEQDKNFLSILIDWLSSQYFMELRNGIQ